MSALDIPGFSALQCVISSLRDTAHFTDEEGDLTDKLRDLRDWVAIRAAVQAAQPEAVGWKLVPIEPTPEMLAAILEPIKWAGGKDAYKAMLASAPTPEPMSAPTAEPGFVMVPVNPTPEMIEAAASFGGRGGYSKQRGDECADAYRDMIQARPLTASPTAPSTEASEPVAAKRQYYYQVTGCKAVRSKDADCICWHDEGTGPLANDPDSIKSWRSTPPPAPVLSDAEKLHTFINAAAGEGLVLDGIDAADLYIALFPDRYAAAIKGLPGEAIEQAIGRASRGAK